MSKEQKLERIGRFEVIRELGRGATSTVYLGKDPENGREVAIKYVRFGGANEALSRRLLKLFQTENALGRRLDHPNIVKIYDAELTMVDGEQRAWIVMEYIHGTPLDKYCVVDNLLPLHRVIGIIFKCCLALDHASRQGVIHRDIKPANILIDDDDNPKITDFGLALNLQKKLERDSTFVMGVGSPAYMSPEQVKGYPLNHKTDLYSLGVLLFQLLTGRLPFRADNPGALVYKIVNMEPPSVCALNPNLPAALDGIIKKALEKDLYNRYRNGADFAKDLSTVRYQILDDDDPRERDAARFESLRQLEFFKRFEDVELWEALRLSVWRELAEKVALMRENDADTRFGVIVSGLVEVSVRGKAICRLGPGQVVGEMAYLDRENYGLRSASVTTLEPTVFLEINAAALSLSSEELQDRIRDGLIRVVVNRLREADKALSKLGHPAVEAKSANLGGCDLELAASDWQSLSLADH